MAKYVVTFTETITHQIPFESDLPLEELSKHGKWYKELEAFFDDMPDDEYRSWHDCSEAELVERELNELEELENISN